jgi:hypothetical protein
MGVDPGTVQRISRPFEEVRAAVTSPQRLNCVLRPDFRVRHPSPDFAGRQPCGLVTVCDTDCHWHAGVYHSGGC